MPLALALLLLTAAPAVAGQTLEILEPNLPAPAPETPADDATS